MIAIRTHGQAAPETVWSLNGALEVLQESIGGMLSSFVAHLPKLVLAVLVLAATACLSWLVQRLYWRVMEGRGLRRSLKSLLVRLVTIALWTGGFLAASVIVFPSVKPESILAGLGLSSIAIGFAFKDIVENFFAGFLILVREPMEIGDLIECEGVEGRVEDITIRDTMIRQLDGQRVVVPNGMLFKNPVWIRTDRPLRRVRLACGVDYDADLEAARGCIEAALDSADSVDRSEDVLVNASAFGGSSIDFDITWWTGSSPADVRRSTDEVMRAIKAELDVAGIGIPFPQRTLHFTNELALARNSGVENDER